MLTALASWPKRAATSTVRLISLLLDWLFWMLACLVAMFGLVTMLLSSASEKPAPMKPFTRKLPIPIRQGSDIFVIMPDDTRVPVEPLAASQHAKAWMDVVGGAMVYEKTKIRD